MSRDALNAWETATWEGSRRAQLRLALALTVRQRLQAAEALADLAQGLAEMPRRKAGKARMGVKPAGVAHATPSPSRTPTRSAAPAPPRRLYRQSAAKSAARPR